MKNFQEFTQVNEFIMTNDKSNDRNFAPSRLKSDIISKIGDDFIGFLDSLGVEEVDALHQQVESWKKV